MTRDPGAFSSFSAMLRGALGDRLAADATTFVGMMAEDGVMEFPYAPPGTVRRLEGRAAVERHLASLAGKIAFDAMIDLVVHETRDEGVVVLEFGCTGRGVATGAPYDQRYVSIITVRGGHIVRYLDYWNPLVVLRALGDADVLTQEGA